MRQNKLTPVIGLHVIYDHESSSGAQLVRVSQEPVLWEGRGGGGGEQREGARSEREKLNERDRAKLRGAHHNKTSPTFRAGWTADRLASLLFSPHGCWVPAKITSAVYISAGGSRERERERGGSLLVKMDHLIRTRSRRRTPLLLFVLLHVTTATQTGKVSARISKNVDYSLYPSFHDSPPPQLAITCNSY